MREFGLVLGDIQNYTYRRHRDHLPHKLTQELLAWSSSFLKEALEDAQQGYLRLSEKHSDVLRENLQVLGDLQVLRQERAALQQERALLHDEQATLLAKHEDLHQEHVALLHQHEALLQVHETLQRQHETLQTDHAGLAKDQRDLGAAHGSLKRSFRDVQQELHGLREQHNSLRQDHLRLQDVKESLLDDVDEMAAINHQMAERINNIMEEWQRTEEEKKHHAQSLLLRADQEKKWALTEAQEKYDMLMKEKKAVEDELTYTKKEYEQAQEEKERLMKDMAEMAVKEQQIANSARTAVDEWHATKETMMQHVESLQAKVDREKNKITSEAPLRYKEIEEERKAMKDELSLLKKAYQEAQEEKVEIRQYHERAVYVAALTIDRLQKGCATISEEHGQGKATDDERTKEEWQVAQLMQEAEHKERLSTIDIVTEFESQDTSENRYQGYEVFYQSEHLVPEEQEKESRENSEHASEHAQRLANAVNEQIFKHERQLLGFEKNDTKEGDETQESKLERKIADQEYRESSEQASEHAQRLANAVNEQILKHERLLLGLEKKYTKEVDETQESKPERKFADQEYQESSEQASEHAQRLANAVNEQILKHERLLLGFEKNDTKEGDETQEKKHQRRIWERNEL
ncbi:trichohyalin-like [Portunus trituberculatus]|uniref:trichohyalin-like n=1 Tax=Portunus trituberculatus TaxID=210409 RepID=UPI001E1CD8F8|nr:trichohyalin-like [Portunus trituberculatus]